MDSVNRTNKYGVDSRREYQRLYQRDYRRARRGQEDVPQTPVRTQENEQPDLNSRVIRFCLHLVNQGVVSLPGEFVEQLSTISDMTEWLRRWCEIYGF
jgi:hypothetical protein